MLNQEIYQRDPATRRLVNEGVASVNDLKEEVLRYELETFVCDGQYQKGYESKCQLGSVISRGYGAAMCHTCSRILQVVP
ncbi:MAG: hypothetical protein AB1634_11870 [Thermodesulfobacteriota bacterium]